MKIKLLILIFGFINFLSFCQDGCAEYYINELIAGNDNRCYLQSGSTFRLCYDLKGVYIDRVTYDVESWKQKDNYQYLTLTYNGGISGHLTLNFDSNTMNVNIFSCGSRSYSISLTKEDYNNFIVNKEKNLKQDKIIFSQVNELISKNDYLNANIKLKSLKYPQNIDGIEDIKNQIQLKIYEYEKIKHKEIDSLAKISKYEAAFIEYSKLTQPDSFNFNLSSWNWQNLVEVDLINQYRSLGYKYRTDNLKKFIELYLGYKNPIISEQEISKSHVNFVNSFIEGNKNYFTKLENGTFKIMISPNGEVFINNKLSDLPKYFNYIQTSRYSKISWDEVMYEREGFNFKVTKCKIFDLDVKTIFQNDKLRSDEYNSYIENESLGQVKWEINSYYKNKSVYSKSFSIFGVSSGNDKLKMYYSKWNVRRFNYRYAVVLDKYSSSNIKIDYNDSCPKNIIKIYFKKNKKIIVNGIELDDKIVYDLNEIPLRRKRQIVKNTFLASSLVGLVYIMKLIVVSAIEENYSTVK